MENKGIKFCKELIVWVKDYLKDNANISRTKLSKEICKKMEWRSSSGKLKDIDCRKTMNELEKRGIIEFPKSREILNFKKKGDYTNLKLSLPSIECSLTELEEIEIIRVCTGEQSKIWHYLMEKYHYLGKVYLYGDQIRYLIKSSKYGWLGGFSFSASAWSLECRDTYIGWSKETKKRQLSKVICNSRFLILPSVKVKNLASHVFSKMFKRLVEDWKRQYHIEPLLVETFVDKSFFKGICYQASNWILTGVTKGRGRNDQKNEKNKSVKDVYLFPLKKDWQTILCEGNPKPKIINEKPVPVDWIDEELMDVELGDGRLNKRLMTLTRDFYATPGGDIPEICNGENAKTKAAYRFFDNPKIEMKDILKPHYDSTLSRIKEHKVVLAVQDTTGLDYSTHPATNDLGYLNKRKVGLIMHDTMAFTEDGAPLGLMDIQIWKRDFKYFGKKAKRKQLPIEEKESYKWLKSYQSCEEFQEKCPNTTIVNVGDRESDIYEYFVEKINSGTRTEILVRSERTRVRKSNEGLIWEILPQQEEMTQLNIHIGRSGNRKARDAKLSVKVKRMNLIPPKTKSDLPEIAVSCIYVKEIEYDETKVKKPLEWMLVTTVEVNDEETVRRVVDWYAKRWGIEIYHKTLKSGCKIEERQLGNADRIENCLAIDLIVAWRVYYLTKLGREVPELPCTVFFEDSEWKALVCYHTENRNPPENPPTLKEAVLMVGKLAGHLGRKGDGMPGIKKMWKGLQKLDNITEMWIIMSGYKRTPG